MSGVEYGVVRIRVGTPPSRNGNPTLLVFLPTALARTWPVDITHVRVVADDDGLHLYPTGGPSPPATQPPPFAASSFEACPHCGASGLGATALERHIERRHQCQPI